MKRTQLQRRTALRPGTRRRMTAADAAARARFYRAVLRRDSYRCRRCLDRPPSPFQQLAAGTDLQVLDAHHVIPKRYLSGPDRWDPDNGVCLCRWHHAHHEVAHDRLPRRLLRPEAVAWARARGYDWYLARAYA